MGDTSKSKTKIQATLAFIFNQDLSKVLLMQKEKPKHHAGMLNGLGGKCELDEDHLSCVAREVEEESGIVINLDLFQKVGDMEWNEWYVTVWTAVYNGEALPNTFPESGLGWYAVSELPPNTITNLKWLIPLSIDVLENVNKRAFPFVRVSYPSN